MNLYTVHDCFAVTADKVELLINTMTAVYIKIYHENDYLKKVDQLIRKTLTDQTQDLCKFIEGADIVEIDLSKDLREVKYAKGKKRFPFPNVEDIIDRKNTNFSSDLRKALNLLK